MESRIRTVEYVGPVEFAAIERNSSSSAVLGPPVGKTIDIALIFLPLNSVCETPISAAAPTKRATATDFFNP